VPLSLLRRSAPTDGGTCLAVKTRDSLLDEVKGPGQIASAAADTVKQTAEAQGQPPSTAQGQPPTHRAA